MNTPRALPPSPPARGSFPLDHHGKCKDAARTYLECLKGVSDAHHLCKEESRSYLACRMERGLMAKEDLETMGFGPNSKVVMGKHDDNPGASSGKGAASD